MKKVFRLLLLLAGLGLGYWLWGLCCPSPEKLVQRQMARLATTATFTTHDSNISRALKISHLTGMFTVDAQVSLDASGETARTLNGRDEIRDAARSGLTMLSALKLEFSDVSIRVAPDKLTADVNCTTRVLMGGSRDMRAEEMHFQLRKIDGSWLISRAETVKTLT